MRTRRSGTTCRSISCTQPQEVPDDRAASKAARCGLAAAGRPVVDCSPCAGTSNVAAATAEGLSAVGTMGDSYVEAFGLEEAASRSFALSHPGPVTLLVDTHGNDRSMEYGERRTVEWQPSVSRPHSQAACACACGMVWVLPQVPTARR